MTDSRLLQSLRIVNFKAFADETLSIRPLTLLTGLNGMGKSTVLQSLLLLRQSYAQGVLGAGLLLNGELAQIGYAPDAKYEGAGSDDEIMFELTFSDQNTANWRFNYDGQSLNKGSTGERVEQMDMIPLRTSHDGTFGTLASKPLFGDSFHYLQAERLGPRISFALSDYAIRRRQIGSQGEFAFHFLGRYASERVLPEMRHPKTDAMSQEEERGSLITQVNAWMQEISPGTQLVLQQYPELAAMRVSYQVERGRGLSRDYRPVNYGFGVTYALPLLVAILSAKPGSLILLENPEAHLHPQGQARMGELMARAASAGIQIICETHSDHVLNAVRLAVKRRTLSPESVAIHFFVQPPGQNGSQVISPEINADGKLDQWPEGFFDEIDRTLDELLS